MRYLFTIILLFNILFGAAQISGEEIKKYNIHKITEKSFEGDSLMETTVSYFDKHGNIYKETSGRSTENTTNEYENGRLKKIIDYDLNGKEEYTTEYFYNPDGSYMTITTEKTFGGKNYSWHKANGDIIKAFGGDTLFYKYNEGGKLTSIESGGSKHDVKSSVSFDYNSNGQLVKVEMPKDEFTNMTESYEYDLNGKRIKATLRTILYGMTRTRIFTYEYNKDGLLIKETEGTNEGGRTTITKNIYEYESYQN